MEYQEQDQPGQIYSGVRRSMSDSNRGERNQTLEALFCAIALFGTVFLIYAIGQNFGVSAGRDQSTARQHYDNTKQDALNACAWRDGVAEIECVAKAIESAQAQSDSRQDLYAQRDMANFALWMLVIAGITMAITGAGVLFVKQTLEATLEAVKQNGEATGEMGRANAIATRQLEAQYRPKLIIETFGQVFMEGDMTVRDGPARQLPVYVGIKARNIGVGACQIDEVCFVGLSGWGLLRERIGILLKSDTEAYITQPRNLAAFAQVGVDINGRGAHILQHIIGMTVVEGHILLHRMPNVIGFVRYTDMLDIKRERGFELSHSGRWFSLVEGSPHDYDKVIRCP